MRLPEDFQFIAHRGASAHAPENTLQAIEAAIRMGSRWVEIDVYAVDGELIVIHDDRFDRTTDGVGWVMEATLEQVRGLDAGHGERIPFLSEVLDCVQGRCGLIVELKGEGAGAPTAGALTARVREGRLGYEQFLVSAFNHEDLLEAKACDPRIRIAPVVAGVPVGRAAFAQELGACEAHIARDTVTRGFVEDAHARGLPVRVYTVNLLDDLERLAAMGADGVFTDRPELEAEALQS